MSNIWGRLVGFVRLVTLLGRWVLLAGVVAAAVGWRLGWTELTLAGLTLLAFLAVALPWTIGRGPEHITLAAEPGRVTVGDRAVARITASAPQNSRTRGLRIEVPVTRHGVTGVGAVDLPSVAAGDVVRRDLDVPTDQRAVVQLGPIHAVRADPIGLARRAVASGASSQVFVWPRTVAVPASSAGVIRDLEGRTTSDPSPSDAAFHALREYVPGDDRRHVHGRTSMRRGQLMVRQFVDVRRSELTLVLGLSPDDYGDGFEFETAVSVVASIAVKALAEQVSLRLVIGGREVAGRSRAQVMDLLAGVTLAVEGAGSVAPSRMLQRLGRTAVGDIVIVTGARTSLVAIAGAAAGLGPDASATTIRVERAAVASRYRAGKVLTVGIGALDDLTSSIRPDGTT